MFTVDAYLLRRFDMKSYNCWHLAKDAWYDLTDERIQSRDIDNFVKLEFPKSPCLYLMRKPDVVPHVGIFYKGRVLHLHPIRGACYEPPFLAAIGFIQTTYYVTKTYENRLYH
jgi:hypothetical protein